MQSPKGFFHILAVAMMLLCSQLVAAQVLTDFYTYTANSKGYDVTLSTAFKTQVNKASGGSFTDSGGYTWTTGQPLPNPAPQGLYKNKPVNGMTSVFYNMKAVTTLDLSLWNTSNVNDMNGMFQDCEALTQVNMTGWNTALVQDFNSMFSGCTALQSVDVSGFNTSSLTTMSTMFSGCSSLTSLDLSTFDTSNVTSMVMLFNGCTGLTSLNISSFSYDAEPNLTYMFNNCGKAVDGVPAVAQVGSQANYNHLTTNASTTGINSAKLVLTYDGQGKEFYEYYSQFNGYGLHLTTDFKAQLNKASGGYFVSSDGTVWRTGDPLPNPTPPDGGLLVALYETFQSLSEVRSLDLSLWDLSNVTSAYSVFKDCSSLTQVNLSGWNTAKMQYMVEMFMGCSSLKSLDLSSFSTKSVQSFESMFSGCSSLDSLDLSHFSTTKCRRLVEMFKDCSSLRWVDFSNMSVSKTPTVTDMFSGAGCVVDGERTIVKVPSYAVYAHITAGSPAIDDTRLRLYYNGVDNVFYTYETITGGVKVALSDDFKAQLNKASGGKYTVLGTTWTTGQPLPNPAPDGMYNGLKVVDFSYLYYQLDQVTELNLTNVDTRYATTLQDMCSNNAVLRTVKLGSMNTENVTNMTGMFSTCDSLRVIEGIDSLNTASVTSFYGMFLNASSLQSMDLSSWNTSNVTNMHRMFEGCRALTSVGDLSGWDVSQVTTLRSMFYNCRSLKSLNLHGWNTGNVTDMGYMFQDCKAMESIDVRGWNTAQSTSFFNMFRNMDALTTLDVSNFSFDSATSYGNMFYDCDNLENVYLPSGITRTFSNSMFNASPKVVINVPVGWLTTYNDLNLHTGRTRQEYLRENDDADMFVSYAEYGVRIKLTRSFTAREWTTLCVPFSLTQEQIKSVFGDETLVARYTTYDSEKFIMGFDLVDNIEQQKPFLIKPSQDVVNPVFESVDIWLGNADFIEIEDQEDAPTLVGVYGYSVITGSYHFIDPSTMTATMANQYETLLGGMRAYVNAYFVPSYPYVINMVINGDALTGDVNGDGAVDVDDVNATINVILGTATNAAADVNNDGTVDIDDVNLIINTILGK